MSQSADTTACPECEGRLMPDKNETICENCGLIVAEDQLDRGPEWRSFDEETRERTGAPLTRSRHDRGLSTEIGRGSQRLTGRKRRQLARMRRQHDRARIGSKADRNRVYAFLEIRRVCGSLSLPDATRDTACMLFEKAQDADLLRGRSIEGVAAAAIYVACRVRGVTRSQAELTAVTKADEDELQVGYDAMNRELGLQTGPIDPREYLPRFASDLELPTDVEAQARQFVDDLDPEYLSGRNPCGIAAGCLYAAALESGHSITQQAVADVADVTPVTLRSTSERLLS